MNNITDPYELSKSQFNIKFPLLTDDQRLSLFDIDDKLAEFENIIKQSVINYRDCFSNGIIISGAPGTGKTYNIKKWLNELIEVGKTSVYCALYAIFAFFLLGLLPHFFSIPNIGNGLYIVLLLIPYLMATSFLGLAASRYFTDSEAPLLMIAFFSVGLIFLSGVSYPMELMPWYWKVAHFIFPAAPGTLAFVKLNSMGASMADIKLEYITLWIQALIYFTISIWVYKKKLESHLIG